MTSSLCTVKQLLTNHYPGSHFSKFVLHYLPSDHNNSLDNSICSSIKDPHSVKLFSYITSPIISGKCNAIQTISVATCAFLCPFCQFTNFSTVIVNIISALHEEPICIKLMERPWQSCTQWLFNRIDLSKSEPLIIDDKYSSSYLYPSFTFPGSLKNTLMHLVRKDHLTGMRPELCNTIFWRYCLVHALCK